MPKPPKPLLDRTYELLDGSDIALTDIAVGADVGIEWLKKLRQRVIDDPSVNRIQRVHDFLARTAAPKTAERQRA